MREAALSRQAREARDQLDERDREDVTALIALIEHDPSVNNRTTFDYPRPPLMLRLYDDGVWQMIYYVPDEATVVIHAIARVPDP